MLNIQNPKTAVAYVDGSFRDGIYSYGCVILDDTQNNIIKEFKGSGRNVDAAASRNVAGEMAGAMRAVKEAIVLGYNKIILHYDYSGIENWVTGKWKTKKELTKKYVDFMTKAKTHIDIDFVKVSAHTGIRYNERADMLAKSALEQQ